MKKPWFEALEGVDALKSQRDPTPADKLIAALCQAVDTYRSEIVRVRKQYTPEQVARAVNLVEGGMSLRRAARAAGVTFHAVWAARQRQKR